MKRKLSQTIKITTLFFLITFACNAADLVVRNAGAGGAYATVSSAIAAATDGDRIIIRPKSSDAPYIENIVVNKSLTFVSEIHGNKYEILGTFDIEVAAGRVVTIHDLELVGSNDITTSSDIASGNRMQINILNSNINTGDGDLMLAKNNVSVEIVGSNFDLLRMKHGKAIANGCDHISVERDEGSTLATDDIYIIANKIVENHLGSNNVSISTEQYTFHVLNNYLANSSQDEYGIHVFKAKINSTNYIQNNDLRGGVDIGGILIDGTEQFNVLITNNVISTTSSSDAIEIINGNLDAYVQATYNIITSSLGQILNVDFEANNIIGANIGGSLSPEFIPQGDAIDAGDPDTIYTDIDLTTGDIGRGGGSFSWYNYWSIDPQQPYIYFLNTPRIIFNGTTTFDANGSGTTN